MSIKDVNVRVERLTSKERKGCSFSVLTYHVYYGNDYLGTFLDYEKAEKFIDIYFKGGTITG